MRNLKEGIEKWIQQLKLTNQEKRLMKGVAIGTVVFTVLLLIIDNQSIGDVVFRNTYGEGNREELFQVKVEGIDESIELEVEISELQYDDDELVQAFQESIKQLDTLILGKNESVDTIYYDLNLVSEIPNTAIEVEWSWAPYEVLNAYGEIQEEVLVDEGTLVQLIGTLRYEEEEMRYVQNILILPLPKSELALLEESIQTQFIQANEQNPMEEVVNLPAEIDGNALVWYGAKSYRGFGILLMGIGIITLLVWRKEEEHRRDNRERLEEMMRDYPQIIYTFSLYIGAGMTVKNAWKRIVQEHGAERYAYAEMKRTHLEMMNGISEIECYEAFGRRCNIRCYHRMGLLFSQNVRKGTKGLMAVLEREASEAYEERKNRVRQEGEKAGTKLLMPMFLMLVVVLVIIIVPAFFSIQI